ncbi:MarR family winged helix-turn-helix transcriptional regulator [Ruminiclostridium cellulolyticum]|uniref:Transcriptional regulator, MarR family n=1 Tax=Ruminiclostridium cellulolyticum (strain ATCC 35319 / DSM 5812 / JCM 6584 / H10) TaxID=394503 RepID=B8I0H2_RUMCH|nr:MarR family transcriptional regulator [Ruminiclostridium cellulolyticum]ACL75547.1 transcriptional regulator, MarR family [Ruminiclostridium cellulolyticum H10]
MLAKEDMNSISNDLFLLVLHLSGRIFNPSTMFKGLPIPPSHTKVLFRLAKLGPCPVSHLANDLIISRPNMTPIIDKLIAEGYADRYDAPNDRRIIMVRLTEKAHTLLHSIEQKAKSLFVEKLSALDEKDLLNLKNIIPELNNIVLKIK